MTTISSGGAAAASAAAPQPVQEATPRVVQQWLRSGGAVLIDVREADEHARERISGSQLVPLSRFNAEQAASYATPGQRLVLHCKGGRRSLDAARMVASLRDPKVIVVSMKGGIDAWKGDGLDVEVNARLTRISVMRQVQLVIGVGLLISAALVWFVHPAFVVVAAFFGAGLTVAGATGTCGLAAVLERMPWNRA
ncbi:MAG: rhodanese-like domain-containing protein [Phycisphaerae bacterium]|nr:rhodanese-like domain-containing protein [Phycisphaerae bacterium]